MSEQLKAGFVRRPVGRTKFTILELLVVITIIAILAAILLPVLNSAREKTKKVTCLSNLKSLSAAHAMYQNDFDGYLLRGQYEGSTPDRWGKRLVPAYIPAGSAALVCKSAMSLEPARTSVLSYGLNQYLGYRNSKSTVQQYNKMSYAKMPSAIVDFGCCFSAQTNRPAYDNVWMFADFGRFSYPSGGPAAKLELLPHKSYNMSFLDGHVASYGYSPIWSLVATGTIIYSVPSLRIYLGLLCNN